MRLRELVRTQMGTPGSLTDLEVLVLIATGLLLFFGCSVIAISLVAYIRLRVLRGLRSDDWPSTEGTITSSDLKTHSSTDVHEPDYTYAALRYEYAVQGVPYQGDKIAMDSAQVPNRDESASALLVRYPPGTPVRVYYCPTHPALSCLNKHVPEPRLAGGLILGAAMLLAGLVILATYLLRDHFLALATRALQELVGAR